MPTANYCRKDRSPKRRLRSDADGHLLAARDRLRARPLHHRPEGRQARRRDRAPQPLAPPAAHRPDARGGAAQEHPDDRPDRRRQDGDLPPSREARQRALHQGGGDEVHRGRLCRPRRRADHPRSRRGRASAWCARRSAARCRRKAHLQAEERVLDALVGEHASPTTRESFRKRLRAGELDDKEVEIQVQRHLEPDGRLRGAGHARRLDRRDECRRDARQGVRPGPHQDAQGHREGLLQAPARGGGGQAARPGRRSCRRRSARWRTTASSSSTRSTRSAPRERPHRRRRRREGVQRDLLPLVEGTTVATKYGPVKTDHILFIASGAFHVSKPSDLLPELQGRLPIRVELRALTEEDFRRILTETEASLIKQYKALMATEGADARLHRRRGRRDRPHRGGGELVGREYRRAAAADGDGAHPRRDLLHRHRPRRRDDRHRRGLRGGARRRSRAERRSEPVHSVGSARDGSAWIASRHHCRHSPRPR